MKAIVSLSGGLDSATVLARASNIGRKLSAIGFYYGSKHNQYENVAAIKIAAHYQVPFQVVDLSQAFRLMTSALLQTGPAIPDGHYEAETMRQTVVPFRNGIFLSILAGIAQSQGAEEIWLGVHAGDHYIYPDCRPDFVKAMERAIQFGTDTEIELYQPFLNDTKAQILREGLELGVPYELTRTCYKAQAIACGKCGSCQERLAAFAEVGLSDPIPYEARTILPKE